ncbi:hypothetical protein F5I97DRAFT_866760 [Phlebopus sp. FC_14]|nr:hypothetical protein F5I97DRAFT_866760 [Phlebopus sp. FC_14]
MNDPAPQRQRFHLAAARIRGCRDRGHGAPCGCSKDLTFMENMSYVSGLKLPLVNTYSTSQGSVLLPQPGLAVMPPTEPGRSGMSHRKPVPKFIPSPPPSPPSSPGAPFLQISLSSSSPVQMDRPPLPEDWRDVIDRVVSRERRSTLPTINTVVDLSTNDCPSSEGDHEREPLRQSPASTEFETTRSFALAPPSPSESDDGEPVSRPDSPTPWTRPGGKRRGQTEYRPPTPPLPRQRSRSPESGCDSPTIVTQLASNSPPLPAIPLPDEISVSEPQNLRPTGPRSLLAPDVPRPLLGQRKVSLPSPPSSMSTHEYPVLAYHPGRDAHTRPPSTLYSEKLTENLARSAHAMSVKCEPSGRVASAEHARTKVETQPTMLPGRHWTLRQVLTRGLKRVGALVVSAFLCRS